MMNLQTENKMMLSICMITYNHANYIQDAIEGVIRQMTDFSLELVIGEDFSSDNTRSICQDYKEKYPQLIRLLPSEKNLGAIPNFIQTLDACSGKYIAYCEGDDYWTDPYKLQKQVDFLEANLDYSLCFHNALVKHDGVKGKDHLFCDENVKEVTSIEDIIASWYIPSVSMVFRNEAFELPDWLNQIYNGDYALHLLLAYKGEIKYFKEVMAVYRKNSGALSAGIGKNYVYINNEIIKLLKIFNIHSNQIYSDKIEKRILQLEYENKHLEIRKKYPFYKYLNTKIWISKIKSIIN
jgi:glycosyltransferase involved in cell wall biosynthesis